MDPSLLEGQATILLVLATKGASMVAIIMTTARGGSLLMAEIPSLNGTDMVIMIHQTLPMVDRVITGAIQARRMRMEVARGIQALTMEVDGITTAWKGTIIVHTFGEVCSMTHTKEVRVGTGESLTACYRLLLRLCADDKF